MNGYQTADILHCLVARHYEREHGASVVSVGNAPRWDIRFLDKTTVEVKVDAKAASTFNAAVEYWDIGRDKPSGILETEADLWLHCVPEGNSLRCFELSTGRLRRLCFEKGKVVTGGDYDSSLLKLIALQEIKKISNKEFLLNGKLVEFLCYW